MFHLNMSSVLPYNFIYTAHPNYPIIGMQIALYLSATPHALEEQMKLYVCQNCNHIEFEKSADSCPVCRAPNAVFEQNDSVFTDSAEKSKEAAVKHIPQIEVSKTCGLIPENCGDAHIRIGEVLHPMEEKHYIQFIDVYQNDKHVTRALLTPNGVYAAAGVHFKDFSGTISAVEFCNLHGHWMSSVMV